MQPTTPPTPLLSLTAALPYDIIVTIMAHCPFRTILALRACCQLFNNIYARHHAHLHLDSTRASAPLRVLAAAKLYARTHLTPSILALDNDPCNRRRRSYSPLLLALAHSSPSSPPPPSPPPPPPPTTLFPHLTAADAAYLTALRSCIVKGDTPPGAYRVAWNYMLLNLIPARQLRATLTVYELWELQYLRGSGFLWYWLHLLHPHLVPEVHRRSRVQNAWLRKVDEIVPKDQVVPVLRDAVEDVFAVAGEANPPRMGGWLVLPGLPVFGETPVEAVAAGGGVAGRMRRMRGRLREAVPVACQVVPESGLVEVFEKLLEFIDEALGIRGDSL